MQAPGMSLSQLQISLIPSLSYGLFTTGPYNLQVVPAIHKLEADTENWHLNNQPILCCCQAVNHFENFVKHLYQVSSFDP